MSAKHPSILALGGMIAVQILPIWAWGEIGREAMDIQNEPEMSQDRVVLRVDDSLGRVAVIIRGELFTEYRYSPDLPKPFFFPLYGPGQRHMTRRYPTEDVPEEQRFRDHPHHRHLYVGWGDLNGVDCWLDTRGRQVTDHVEILNAGNRGTLIARETWVDENGNPVMTAERKAIFYDTPSTERIMDFHFTFIASQGDLRIGDTNEASTIAFKPNPQMVVPAGGRITDASGRVNEGQIWGKQAVWCDYSGTIDGLEVGLAILDHPENVCHPTYWHTRDYGYLGANCFMLSHYTRNPENRGDYHLPAGERLTFRYRIVIHEGSADPERLNALFEEYGQGIAPIGGE